MKKKIGVLIILFLVLLLFGVDVAFAVADASIYTSCDGLFTPEAFAIIRRILGYIQLLAPMVLIVMVSVDFGSIVFSGDPNGQSKKALGRSIKRTIATMCVFLTSLFVGIALSIAGFEDALVKDPFCTAATGTKASEVVNVILETPNDDSNTAPKKDPIITPGQNIPNDNLDLPRDLSVSWGQASGTGYVSTVTVGNKTYKIYQQKLYAHVPYSISPATISTGSIASEGCGPTAVAIVASGYGKNLTPPDLIKYKPSDAFSLWATMQQIGIKVSFPKKPVGNGEVAINEIRNHLATGRPVFAVVGKSKTGNPASLYTNIYHIIVLLAEVDGKLIIGDPGNTSAVSTTLKSLVVDYMINIYPTSPGSTDSSGFYMLVEQ